MIHTKWLKLTKLLHITDGKFLKNTVAAVLILGCISTMQTFACDDSDLSDYPSVSSGDLTVRFYAKKGPNSNFKEKEEGVTEPSLYQEDLDDRYWMESLEKHPLLLIDARAVGRPVDIRNIDQRQYTRDIRYGRYSNVSYKKYSDVIVNLSLPEREIINFVLVLILTEREVDTTYNLQAPVTLESLLIVAKNIREFAGCDLAIRKAAINILDRYLYY